MNNKLIVEDEPVYEGGEDGFDPLAGEEEKPKKLTKQERKLAKYQADIDGYHANDAVPGASSAIKDGTFLKERGMTDICCLLIFVLTIIGMIVATTVGFYNGNLAKFLSPID